MRVQSLGRKDQLEKEMATHSSILAWEVPWTEEPGMPTACGVTRVWYDLRTKYTYTHILDTEPGIYLSSWKRTSWHPGYVLWKQAQRLSEERTLPRVSHPQPASEGLGFQIQVFMKSIYTKVKNASLTDGGCEFERTSRRVVEGALIPLCRGNTEVSRQEKHYTLPMCYSWPHCFFSPFLSVDRGIYILHSTVCITLL